MRGDPGADERVEKAQRVVGEELRPSGGATQLLEAGNVHGTNGRRTAAGMCLIGVKIRHWGERVANPLVDEE